MIQGFNSAHLEMQKALGSREETACESLPPVLAQVDLMHKELSLASDLVGKLYDRLEPVTVFEPPCVSKEEASERTMCDLERDLHNRVLYLRTINLKLDALIEALRI